MTRLPLAIVVLVSLTNIAQASPIFESPTQPQQSYQWIKVAQADAATLSDMDLQRMNFYAGRSVESLTQTGGADAQDLQNKILRLIDAGQRSGLDQQQTAAFFQAYVAERDALNLPANWLAASGQFDAAALFENVVNQSQQGSDDVDVAAILQADLTGLQSATNGETTIPEPVVVEAPTIDGPVIPDNATAEVRDVLERVQVRGDQWYIEVIRGDRLSVYAQAIYGDRGEFRRIYDANRNVLNTPNVLEIGYVLVLPRDQ